jgi:hypothetical protein
VPIFEPGRSDFKAATEKAHPGATIECRETRRTRC